MRVALIEIAPSVIIGLLSGHDMCEMTSTMPADAEIVNAIWEPHTRRLFLSVTSSDFADIPEGAAIPDFTPIYTTRRLSMGDHVRAVIRRET